VFSAIVDAKIKEICSEIQKRYEITFLEIGTDDDHVHFLVQSVPMYSPTKLVQIIKSITARKVFKACPEVRKYLRGGKFWSDGYLRQRANDKELCSTTGQIGGERSTSVVLIPCQLAAG
jgi:REP element-mobilizing transposase RayT